MPVSNTLMRHAGWMKVFRSEAGFAGFAAELALCDEIGVKYSVFDREQLRQIEPGLKPVYEKAVLFDDTCGVIEPGRADRRLSGTFHRCRRRNCQSQRHRYRGNRRWLGSHP